MSGPAGQGGGFRSSQLPVGGFRSSRGGVQVQPVGGEVRSSQGGGVSHSSRLGGGGSAKIGQQNEYSLLHGGRYVSCVHAGGLSCPYSNFTPICTDRILFGKLLIIKRCSVRPYFNSLTFSSGENYRVPCGYK